MLKGLLVIALLAITSSVVAQSEDLINILPGEFAPGFLQPGENLIYQIELTEEEIGNRSVTLAIFTTDKEFLEEDEDFGTNLTVLITRELTNYTLNDVPQAESSRGVAFWPSSGVAEGVYYVIVYNLQQVNASFNVTYLLLSDTQFQLNEPVRESLTPFEIIYFHVFINHTAEILLETTAVRFDLTFDSVTPILDENSVERLLTISQGDYPTPARHLERANIASDTQFLNEFNETIYRLTLFEEIPILDYLNMPQTKWIMGFYNTAEYQLEATFSVSLIDRSPGALDQTDDLVLLNNRKHMLRMSYFMTPDPVPEALVYFEFTLPRPLLTSERVTLHFFNTLVLDVNNAVTYTIDSSDAPTEYFIAGRQDQSVTSRDYAVAMLYSGPEREFGNVSVTPRYMEVYTLPLFTVLPHRALANRAVVFEIPIEEGSLPYLRENRISTVFHMGLNVRETDITVRIQLRQNRLPTPAISDITYESSVEDLFFELDKSRPLYGSWYAVVDVEDANEISLPYSIVAAFQNRFEQTIGANIVNQIQPNRWHYYTMTYHAVDNQGVFFDLAYTNHIEGFDHEISREVNFLVSNETANPFPTFANHAAASRVYWPLTENFVEGADVVTRQSVYLPSASFVAGQTYTLYTGLFAAPDSTQVNHTYEFMATGIREYTLEPSVEYSVNGHTWIYLTTDMQVPTTLLEAPSRYIGEVHLTSQSNFVANVSVAISEDYYPAFPPNGDNVRDIDIFGELSHFAPVNGEGLQQLAVRNWGPITVHFNIGTGVHIETPVTLPINNVEITVQPKQYRFFTTTRSQTGPIPTLSLSIERSAKKRSIEQGSGNFVVLISNDGEFPAVSDFDAESSAVTGHRVEEGTDAFSFETTSTSSNVVFAIYNEGTAPLQATLSATLQVPGAPVAFVPVSPPVVATPIAVPVASAPVHTPVAATPVHVPIAPTPVAVPVAQTPVHAPVAQPPVYTSPVPGNVPVYQTPVAAPVYVSPPVEQQGTPLTDVVQTPSGPSPMHPLYIILIVAGCLAVVGVGVAVIIKLVQNSRKKKTSLSGLEYVELVDDTKRR